MVRCGVEGNAFGCLLEKDEKPDTLLGFPFESYLRVDKIDTIKVRDLQFRRFTLTLLDAYKEYYRTGEASVLDNVVWVEGVGSGAGPFTPWMPLPARESIFTSCCIGKTCKCPFPSTVFYLKGKIMRIITSTSPVADSTLFRRRECTSRMAGNGW